MAGSEFTRRASSLLPRDGAIGHHYGDRRLKWEPHGVRILALQTCRRRCWQCDYLPPWARLVCLVASLRCLLGGLSMKAYRLVWHYTCAGLAVLGTCVAFTLGVPAVSAVFGVAAVIVGALAINLILGEDDGSMPLRRILQSSTWWSLIGAIASVSVVGLWMMFEAWALVPAALAFGGSPRAVQLYARWLRPRPRESCQAQRPQAPTVEDIMISQPERASEAAATELRSLTDASLCRAWQVSFSALQISSSSLQRLRVVQVRQELLDEVERRNPEGLMAWLASGARAAGSPSKFILSGANLPQRLIGWDELLPKQDL